MVNQQNPKKNFYNLEKEGFQDEELKLIKKDPEFFQAVKECFDQTKKKSSQKSRNIALDLARAHKKKMRQGEKVNSSERLNWTKPMINPIQDLKRWFVLDGFSIGSLRVAAILLIGVISGLSYVVYYQYQKSTVVLIADKKPSAVSNPNPNPNPTADVTLIPMPKDVNKERDVNKTDNNFVSNEPAIANTKLAKKSTKPSQGGEETLTQMNNKETEEMAYNVNKINSTENVFRSTGVKDISLVTITRIYIDSFGKEKENEELKEAVAERFRGTDFRLLEPSETVSEDQYGLLRKKGLFIEIINPNNNLLLWQKSMETFSGSSREVADKIVNQLLTDIREIK